MNSDVLKEVSMDIKTGDLVAFKTGLYADDAGAQTWGFHAAVIDQLYFLQTKRTIKNHV